MNKTELIDTVAKDSGLAPTDAARAVESILSAVTDTLNKGDEVTIPGSGKFSVAHRGAREGRYAAAGAALKIKASKAPKFPAGATLKATVAGKNT